MTVTDGEEVVGLGATARANSINEVRSKVMVRWFLDNGVDSGPISELSARVDNAITEQQEGLWAARSQVRK